MDALEGRAVCSSIFLLLEKMDHRSCAEKLIIRLRKFEIIVVTLGKSTMNRTQVQLWYNPLKECREDVNVLL